MVLGFFGSVCIGSYVGGGVLFLYLLFFFLTFVDL